MHDFYVRLYADGHLLSVKNSSTAETLMPTLFSVDSVAEIAARLVTESKDVGSNPTKV